MNKREFIGKNCFDELSILFEEKNFQKILIITGKNSFEKSGAKIKLEKLLQKKNHKTFFKENDYPEINELKAFISAIDLFKPDVILSVGGGAVLDLAKIGNCLCFENNYVDKIKKGTLSITKKFTKVIAIPTTAGSGAEVTSNAVLYIDKIKYSIEGKNIKPDYAFVDPELVMSLPNSLSASSGFDAMSQAIESLFSKKSNNESVKYALKSLEYSYNNIESHVNKKTFLTAYNMCNASFFSGKAINISKTTAPHAVSYPFTAYFGIKHGHAVSLTLTDFIEYNFLKKDYSDANFNLDSRFKLIFETFKVNGLKDLIPKINKILSNINLETNFSKLNISGSNNIEKVVSNINAQRLNNNPVPLTVNSVKEILMKKIKP